MPGFGTRRTLFWTITIHVDPAWSRDRKSRARIREPTSRRREIDAAGEGDDDRHPGDRAANSNRYSRHGKVPRSRIRVARHRAAKVRSHGSGTAAVPETSLAGKAVNSSNGEGRSRPSRGDVTEMPGGERDSARQTASNHSDKDNAGAILVEDAGQVSPVISRQTRRKQTSNNRVVHDEVSGRGRKGAISSGHDDRFADHGGTSKRQTGWNRHGSRISGPGGRDAEVET